jgi:hypothetical protein
MAACGGGRHAASGTTTTTNADAYATAYTVCLQLNNTDAARNAEPATLTDQAADDIFVGLALQLKPAVQKDPRAWAKLNATATTLRRQLMSTDATDDQIESSITKMADLCKVARKRPKTIAPPVQVPVSPNPTTTSPTSTTA